jgi:CRP/FNR family cyclic AMP-dependent transcriptional regulator
MAAIRGFYGALTWAARTRLGDLGRVRTYAQGEVIYSQGDPSTNVRVILEGSVKLTARPASRETLLEIRASGDLLGEREVLQGLNFPEWPPPRRAGPGRPVAALRGGLSAGPAATYSATATTLITTKTLVIDGHDFARFLAGEIDAWAAVAQDLHARLTKAEQRLSGFASETANRRLARALLQLSMTTGVPGVAKTATALRLSQAELASWIGVSTETVERIVRGWRKRGIVDTGYRYITVLDLDAVMRIAGTRRAA